MWTFLFLMIMMDLSILNSKDRGGIHLNSRQARRGRPVCAGHIKHGKKLFN